METQCITELAFHESREGKIQQIMLGELEIHIQKKKKKKSPDLTPHTKSDSR